MLPTPIRLLAMSAWSIMHDPAAAITTPRIAPMLLILVAQVHALAFHAPSLWSSRVHRQTCVSLTEYIFYYGLLQAVVIECMVQAQTGAASLAACYCGLYYAWGVGERVLGRQQKGTLAPYTVVLSLVLYSCITIPSLHGLPASASAADHLLAWTVADGCHYAMLLLLAPPKTGTWALISQQ